MSATGTTQALGPDGQPVRNPKALAFAGQRHRSRVKTLVDRDLLRQLRAAGDTDLSVLARLALLAVGLSCENGSTTATDGDVFRWATRLGVLPGLRLGLAELVKAGHVVPGGGGWQMETGPRVPGSRSRE